jgi:hypothetical protein
VRSLVQKNKQNSMVECDMAEASAGMNTAFVDKNAPPGVE